MVFSWKISASTRQSHCTIAWYSWWLCTLTAVNTSLLLPSNTNQLDNHRRNHHHNHPYTPHRQHGPIAMIIMFHSFHTRWDLLTLRMAYRIPLQNRMNFWKNPKRPLTPPPIFGKLCCIGQIVSVNIINNNTKHALNPEITLLFNNFMLKKPCLKFPKSAT